MKSKFRELLESKEIIVFDGGMGTSLFDQGVFINRCYDALNLSDSKLVKTVHQEFAKAGAMVVETNTFGANRYKLSSFDLGDKVAEINKAGVQIAKEAVGEAVFVAGAVGPLGVRIAPLGAISQADAKKAFKEQVAALVDGGADLILFETFSDLNEIELAISAIVEYREFVKEDIPIVASMTVDETGYPAYGSKGKSYGPVLESLGVDMVGINCSVGPKPMLEALEKLRGEITLPISIMPNAGLPTKVEGRTLYVCSPDYMARYASRFIQAGAQAVGGCCGTTAEHIKTLATAVRQLSSEMRSLEFEVSSKEEEQPAREEIPLNNRSRLASMIAAGRFVATVELAPPHGWDLGKVLKSATTVHYAGFDGINIPDGPRASARMGPLAMASVIQREVGIETLMHYACRDRNLLGMQSDLLGAYAMGLHNVLVITGDPPVMGDYPNATAVFDVDAIGLTKMITRLNQGQDLSGRSIGNPTGFFTVVGLNPTAVNPEKELERFRWKVEAGANAVITQPVFDVDQLLSFLDRFDDSLNIPVMAGIWPLQSLRNAEFLANEVPGVSVPSAVLERMEKARKQKRERAEGEQIAIEIFEQVKDRIQGIQVAAPFGRVSAAVKVLNAARKIQGLS